MTALAAAGVFSGSDDGGSESPDPTVAPTTVAEEPDDGRVSVVISYPGDAEGCGLGINIAIGDRTFFPTGVQFTASDVARGNQSYAITGSITCPISGSCQASGQGTIGVEQDDSFVVQWGLVDIGVCQVWLAET